MLVNFGAQQGTNASWRNRKVVRIACVALVSVVCLFLVWPKADSPIPAGTPPPEDDTNFEVIVSPKVPCPVDVDLMRQMNVRNVAGYRRQEIIAVPPSPSSSSSNVPMTQHVDVPLLDWKFSAQEGCTNPQPITLQVPALVKRANASQIDFGVATTLERLNVSLDAFAHWAGHTGTRIFALIEPADWIPEVQRKADSLGINLFISQSEEEYNRRYFSLVDHLAKHMRDETRWACIIDDDTFFPSITALMNTLNKYDPTKRVYIGSVSENMAQLAIFGLVAYGGAGVFLSRALLEALAPAYEACQTMAYTGDRKISYCVYQETGTLLTIEHGLHQLDMHGDLSGFFESGREPPLSVHHWKSWFDMDMVALSAVSAVCGDDCLLRRYRFNDQWMLTNGFSVVQYGKDVNPEDGMMEQSWDDREIQDIYLHELAPLRVKDREKKSYILQHAVVDSDRVRQWYVMRMPESGDQVLELVWRKG